LTIANGANDFSLENNPEKSFVVTKIKRSVASVKVSVMFLWGKIEINSWYYHSSKFCGEMKEIHTKEVISVGKQAVREGSLTMSVSQAAVALGISDYLARRLVKEGTIRSIRLGQTVRVPKKTIAEILEN
jgi:excisionase family DNA binding protein